MDWNTRLKIAFGASQGLAYLHQDCKPQVIHRDVKSCNILLNANMEAHLCDFGLAKNIQPTRTHTSTFVLGTIGYIDPEYAQTSRLNEKSDVYSFGIVLLELLMGKKAVDDEVNLLDWVSPPLRQHNLLGFICHLWQRPLKLHIFFTKLFYIIFHERKITSFTREICLFSNFCCLQHVKELPIVSECFIEPNWVEVLVVVLISVTFLT